MAPKTLLMSMPDVGTDEDFDRHQAPWRQISDMFELKGQIETSTRHPMTIAERIYETVKSMPEQQAAEVLDFAEFLMKKRCSSEPDLSVEESRKLSAEMQAWVESQPQQPENAADFIRRLRDEARACCDFRTSSDDYLHPG